MYESLQGSNKENKNIIKSRNKDIKSRYYEIKSRNYEIIINIGQETSIAFDVMAHTMKKKS